ncbi:hypothetical protein [Sphingomonas koreensis]|jgi:hypothetical protein|nr:hypothetical protein [Sphingomonas koreensis]
MGWKVQIIEVQQSTAKLTKLREARFILSTSLPLSAAVADLIEPGDSTQSKSGRHAAGRCKQTNSNIASRAAMGWKAGIPSATRHPELVSGSTSPQATEPWWKDGC